MSTTRSDTEHELTETIRNYGVAVFQHTGSDVVHHVYSNRGRWCVSTRCSAGLLREQHYRSLKAVAMAINGAHLCPPEEMAVAVLS